MSISDEYFNARTDALADIMRDYSIWLCTSDFRAQSDRYRAFYMCDPHNFTAYRDAALEKLRAEYGYERFEAASLAAVNGGLTEFAPSYYLGDDAEYEFQLYGIGCFGTSLQREPMRDEFISEAQAETLREILYDEWFNRENCEIFIYEGIVPINSPLFAENENMWTFTREFAELARPLTPIIDRPEYAVAVDATENVAPWSAEARMILFGLKFRRDRIDRPVLHQQYRYGSRFPYLMTDESKFQPDLLRETPYGKRMQQFLSDFSSLRWHISYPIPVIEALSQLDYCLFPVSFLTCASHVLMTTGCSVSDLIASPACFVDRYLGYCEMRVAFAHKDDPDKILGAAAATIHTDEGDWFAVYAEDIRRLLTQAGIPTIPLEDFGCSLEAEPEIVDRFFMTSTGKIVSFDIAQKKPFADDLPPMPPTIFN